MYRVLACACMSWNWVWWYSTTKIRSRLNDRGGKSLNACRIMLNRQILVRNAVKSEMLWNTVHLPIVYSSSPENASLRSGKAILNEKTSGIEKSRCINRVPSCMQPVYTDLPHRNIYCRPQYDLSFTNPSWRTRQQNEHPWVQSCWCCLLRYQRPTKQLQLYHIRNISWFSMTNTYPSWWSWRKWRLQEQVQAG